MDDKVRVNLWMKKDMHADLSAISERTGRSLSDIIRALTDRFIRDEKISFKQLEEYSSDGMRGKKVG